MVVYFVSRPISIALKIDMLVHVINTKKKMGTLKPMIHKLKRLLKYPPLDILYLIFLITLLYAAKIQLHLLPSKKILYSLQNRTLKNTISSKFNKSLGLEKVVPLLEVADRNVPGGPSCLRRVVVLKWILKWLGQPSALKLGVRRTDNLFLAHAWLEVNNQTLETNHGEPIFETLLSLPSKS